ncbi:hypothetical protein P3X46_031227 [Hevea brasiliensis]|uniref:RING-type E3 ubiquitin transferase n=1 Tax=Hevea brasiliensis TaxID=3981 RepID=A0ABQ9KMM7_HEVBR|nr:uncharacterized protein LOC110643899 [Hevea brasiliensis]XP_021652123.2 uncharacterized protein LOC110643899 [Hevea brasiliensis]KAJ9140595.1 hypothetical protein P3X46_031227 [Hevea brasiliensis]KAJ9140596.1 hypothetical protein P3X46_031227 [Hevea brasiliensis]
MANISQLHRYLYHDSAVDDSHQRHHNYRRPHRPRNLTVDHLFSSSSSDPHSPHATLHDPYPLSEHTNFNIRTLGDDDVSDPESVILGGPDLLDRENQVSFVLDLFQQRVEQSQVMGRSSHLVSDALNESDFGVIEEDCELGMGNLELDLELGFDLDGHESGAFQNIGHNHSHSDNNNDYSRNIVIDDDDDDDFFVERRISGIQSCGAESTVSFRTSAMRVAGFGSDSDSEDNENSVAIDLYSGDEYGLDRANIENDNYDNVDEDDEEDATVTIPLCWDSLQLEDHRENNEDFEWEEVDGRVDERDVLSMFVDDEEASVSLSISPIIAPEDMVSVERVGGLGNLEWEVLLNANNFDSNLDRIQDHNAELYFGDHDDFIYTSEYEMLFGQFAENENSSIGRPPAAKSVVEKLPYVVLTKEDVENNNSLCAVCKDEINVGERAKQLPCTHRYHGECIVPWLGIRNTCPVCRYELPTDDADYERKKVAASQGAVTTGRRL